MAAFDNMEYADDAGLHIGMDLSTSIAVAMVNPANNHVLAQTFEVTDSLAWIYFFAPN
jgi:Ethanolamine utilization protein EutJ (predicted chaperonin)